MLKEITGLHHITSLSGDAEANNRFFTQTLGLRRVKKTVNFDVPEVYHLYYGNELGSPGTVMTYFPYPGLKSGRPGAGEVGTVAFSVPEGSLPFWQARLSGHGVQNLEETGRFGEERLEFDGPDGDRFALVAFKNDPRTPWQGIGISQDHAIRGFHSATIRVMEVDALKELISFMNYEPLDVSGRITRFKTAGGNGADVIDIEALPDSPDAEQGAGSVHHIAFCVADRQAQLNVQRALRDTGYSVTPVIDRDYFWAIYFRTPGGVLFEVATVEPGFDRDEAPNTLGQDLKLPSQHAHLREHLEKSLPPLET